VDINADMNRFPWLEAQWFGRRADDGERSHLLVRPAEKSLGIVTATYGK
jgi:hypothetical protein